MGVDTVFELEACVVVGVFTTVNVTTEVLAAAGELVALVAVVALVALVVTGTVDVVVAAVLVEVLVAVVLGVIVTVTGGGVDVDSAVNPPGGSRWNIIPSDARPLAPAVVPTAKPSVLERRNMLWRRPTSWAGNGGLMATVVQAEPS